MNIRPFLRRRYLGLAAAARGARYITQRRGESVLSRDVVRGTLGVLIIASLIVFLTRGAKACARGEMTPEFDRDTSPESAPRVECTRAHAHTGTRAREEA
jgi:hypothetical protein